MSILSLPSLRGSALRDSSVESAQCGCGALNPGRRQHSPVGCGSGQREMRDRSCAGYVAATSLVGGRFLAGSSVDQPFLMLVSCLVLLDNAAG